MQQLRTAGWGRRILALCVDWFACTMVVLALIGPAGWSDDRLSGLYTLVVFWAETAVLTTLAGGSFGKLMTRLRVVRAADGGQLAPLPSLVRALLVCLVVPPMVFKPDGRGLHDLAAGSMTVPLSELLARTQ